MKNQFDENEIKRLKTLSYYETHYYNKGYLKICGIDEVGRGPLAGPVVAACVILPREFMMCGINDSKKIPKKKHREFYTNIIDNCVDYAVGIIEPEKIDEINILNATKMAMIEAYKSLKTSPDILFIDHIKLEKLPIEQLNLTKGDSLSVSIAAASIVAKYTRDMIMKKYSSMYPEYGFEKNSGYGTKNHIKAIKEYGISDIHRKTFVKKFI